MLGDGEITRALKVTAAKFSGSAKAKIEKAGGQAVIYVWTDPRRLTLPMFSAFTNSLKIPELRSRIFYTLALLFVARVGAPYPAARASIPSRCRTSSSSRSGGAGRRLVGPLQHVHGRRRS